jgi:hypothetical protein
MADIAMNNNSEGLLETPPAPTKEQTQKMLAPSSAATCAETPSTTTGSPHSLQVVKVEEGDNNTPASIAIKLCDKAESPSILTSSGAKQKYQASGTPPWTPSTSRMLFLSRMSSNVPSPDSEEASIAQAKSSQAAAVGFVTPSKDGKIQMPIDESPDISGYIQPHLLFSDTPTQSVRSEETSRQGNLTTMMLTNEPGHLTPRKDNANRVNYPVPYTMEGILSKPYAMDGPVISLVSECPFDCINDYKQEKRVSSFREFSIEDPAKEAPKKTLFGWFKVGSKKAPSKTTKIQEKDLAAAECPFDCISDYKQEKGVSSSGEFSIEEPAKEAPKKILSGWFKFGSNKAPSKKTKIQEKDLAAAVGDPLENISPGDKRPPAIPDVEDAELGKSVVATTEEQQGTIAASQSFGFRSTTTPQGSSKSPSGEAPKLPKSSRPTINWYRAIFYGAVIGVLIVIVVIASMLLMGRMSADNKSLEESDADIFSDGSTENPEVEDSEVSFPGGFFSTSNMYCTSAFPLEKMDRAYSGTTMESEWDDTIDKCGDNMSVGRASWFSYIADESRLMEASTCEGTDFDTQITITSGASCNELTCVTFNDQGCGDQSRATWYAEEGKTYYINVHGFRQAQGEFSIALRKPSESNDECVGAEGPVRLGSSVFGTTSGSSKDEVEECGDVNLSNPGVWYVLDNNVDGWVRAEAIARDLGFVAQISVYSGDGCGELQCQTGSSSGSVAWFAESVTTYYVLVNGLNAEAGDFDLSISWDWKDTCDHATSLSASSTPFTASTSQARLHKTPSCGESGPHTAPGMWFTVQGTGTLLTVGTCNSESELDTQISVFRDGCGALECIAGTGPSLPCDENGAVTWATEAGEDYLIYVSGRGSRVGDYALTLEESPVLGGGMCSSAISLGSTSTSIEGSTVDAKETMSVCGDISTTRGVWYEIEGSGSTMTVWTCNPNTEFDARISLFTGSCGSLECEAYTSATCSELSGAPLRWNTEIGTNYYMLVHGPDDTTVGNYVLSMKEEDVNDSCGTALPIEMTSNTYYGSSVDAAARDVIPCESKASEFTSSVWYTFLGTGSQITFSTCSEQADFATDISVFSGRCGDLDCVGTDKTECGQQSVISFNTIAAEVYSVRVQGANPDELGDFILSVSVRSVFFGW